MSWLKRNFVISCCFIFCILVSSCGKKNPFIGEWRVSRFPALDNMTPAFNEKFNPLYKSYFYINKDGSLSYYVAVTGTDTRIDNDGYWEFENGKLKTFLRDQDNGGYVKGLMKITDDYIIYEVDGEMSMILVKE
ncbi:hypothetical protein [Treponema sp.]|uniref:hypothetical protein n=1 Tax=Treponema sp. TaxID=166 RepID=UPI00257A6B17|nr:hypothetical protein [Treponema sp.]MBE6354863.1 hypothetical protein [Treponema sp.]